MNLDDKDLKILETLKSNSDWSTQKISKKTGIPITTVHNRIKRLKKEQVIKNYTVNVDYRKLGKSLAAFVLVTVDYKYLKETKKTQYELAEKLMGQPHVESAAVITGVTDILIKVRVSDIEQLSDFVTRYLRNFDGVENTTTAVILREL